MILLIYIINLNIKIMTNSTHTDESDLLILPDDNDSTISIDDIPVIEELPSNTEDELITFDDLVADTSDEEVSLVETPIEIEEVTTDSNIDLFDL
jgi:hypothetical protein